jgi:dihydrofolate reductase
MTEGDRESAGHAAENLAQADALLFGRVTYEMMEAAWRPPAPTGARPDWMEPFARTIDAAKKYVVSSTLDRVDWNAELVRGDLGKPFSSSSWSRVRDCSWEA